MRSRHALGSLAELIARAPCTRAGAVRSTIHDVRGRPFRARAAIACRYSTTSRPRASAGSAPSTRSATRSAVPAAEAPSETESLPEQARHVLRHLVNSVVVCTAHVSDASHAPSDPDDIDTGARVPVGLTMSSFTSLSLYPTPVVTFNIAVPSRTEAALSAARHFMIHILAGDHHGAEVANVFRAGNAHPSSTLHALHLSGSQIVWPPTTTGAVPRPSEQPFVQGPGVLCVLRCRLMDQPLGGLVPVRDHVVVLGEVLEIMAGSAKSLDEASTPPFGLVYGDRSFRQLDKSAMPIDPPRKT